MGHYRPKERVIKTPTSMTSTSVEQLRGILAGTLGAATVETIHADALRLALACGLA
jgi:hypothetical protein